MLKTSANVAIYCRLSRDDGNVDESQSIQFQKEFLTNYAKQQSWNLVNYYVDDGYSGTDFNRPAFKNLLDDIENDKINIVITKDLSRLGRNYIQTGYYTEEYFPSHGIRYIAVNDSFDTNNAENSDFVPFKNIINEWYAKDISKKIRFTLDNKAKKGEPRNTVFPIFGYAYNENYERIPDSETAPIVRYIFEEFIKLGSTTEVVKSLRLKKIKIPSYYNAIKYGYNNKKILTYSNDKLITWSTDTIRDIITNTDYLGTYTTARSKSINYKMKKRLINENPYVFESRYEPLIDKDTWLKANKLLCKTRAGRISLEDNEYKGLVFCGDCGKLMKYDRKRDSKTKRFNFYRYYCSKKNCSHINGVQKKYLNEIIKQELLFLKDTILKERASFMAYIDNYDYSGRTIKINVKKEIATYLRKSKKIDNYITKTFEQNVNGLIPNSLFTSMMTKYNKEKQLIELHISELRNQINYEDIDLTSEERKNKIFKLFEDISEDDILKQELINSVINRIVISSTSRNNQKRKYEYKITISYHALNQQLREFSTIYE